MLGGKLVRLSALSLPLAVILVFAGGCLGTPATQVNQAPVVNTNTQTNTVADKTNKKVATENVNAAAAADEGDEVPAVDVEAQARDAQRVASIRSIQNALDRYRVQTGAYPETLDVLVPGFLSAIPKNLDESDFSYTPIGSLPAQFFDLCYELEVGTGEIGSGYHCANPDGVANP